MPCDSLDSVQIWFPILSFADEDGGGSCSLWSLPGDKWPLLKFSVFLRCLFYGLLAKRGAGFGGGFFGSVAVGVSSLPDSSVSGLGYLRQNQRPKNQELTTMFFFSVQTLCFP